VRLLVRLTTENCLSIIVEYNPFIVHYTTINIPYIQACTPSPNLVLCVSVSAAMPSKRKVNFSPCTNPPASPNHIYIVPNTEIFLRKSKAWIPVQVFDMINLRLSATSNTNSTNQLRFLYGPSYHTPPYTALLHDLAFITSFPITPEVIAEIQEIRGGLRPPPKNATNIQRKQWECWQVFDEMNAQFIALMRQCVDDEENLHWQVKGDVARLPKTIKRNSQRAAEAMGAQKEARRRAWAMEDEAAEIRLEGQSISIIQMGSGDDGDEDDDNEAEGPRLLSPPDSPLRPTTKKRRLR
jgi:hypothetical protein